MVQVFEVSLAAFIPSEPGHWFSGDDDEVLTAHRRQAFLIGDFVL